MPIEPTIQAFVNDVPKDVQMKFIQSVMENYSDWGEYIKHYPDLAGIENGLWHYLNNGAVEKRMGVKFSLPDSPTPPTPGGWQPPTTPGMHEIVKKDGPFGMSVARIKTGLRIGTYRQGGTARLYDFDGQLHERMTSQIESFYMIVQPPDDLSVITTEVPAQVLKEQPDGSFSVKRLLPNSDSVAFEILPYGDGLVTMAVDRAAGTNISLFKGDANGNNFNLWKTLTGKQWLNFGTDGNTVRMVGNYNNQPCIGDENGNIIKARTDYAKQTYSYAIGKGGIWNMGVNALTQDPGDEHRRAYIDLYDGTNLRTVYSCVPPNDPPWIMDMQITPDGKRYAVASSWQETDHQNSILLESTDNGNSWHVLTTIPMPSCIAMFFADSGVYLVGGQYDQFMKVLFYKF